MIRKDHNIKAKAQNGLGKKRFHVIGFPLRRCEQRREEGEGTKDKFPFSESDTVCLVYDANKAS